MKSSIRQPRKSLFVIRDDDLSYFNTPDDVLKWYGDVFAEGIPVGFSTIPFATSKTDFHHSRGGEPGREYGISENRELIDFITSNPMIEIMQHGCNHENVGGRYEYAVSNGLFEKTARGKAELCRAFGNVSVFVPPHDQISNHGILAIEHAGLNVLRSKGSKNFLPRCSYGIGLFKMILHILKYKFLRKTLPPYPFTLDFGNHKEAYTARIELGTGELFWMMKDAFDKGGHFVVVTHINDMSAEKKQTLLDCISFAKKLGYQCAKPSELFRSYE